MNSTKVNYIQLYAPLFSTMSNVLKNTVHKGSRSIDFISHGLKSSITPPTGPLETEKPLKVKENKIKRIRAFDTLIHPFYRPSEVNQLIRTIRHGNKIDAGPMFILETNYKGEHKVNLSPYFTSSREVIALFKKLPESPKKLELIPNEVLATSIPEDVKVKIDQLIGGSQESWSKILETQMISESGQRVTNEDKVYYILESLTTGDINSIQSITAPLKDYMTQVENSRLASNSLQFFFNQIMKYEYSDLKQVSTTVTNLENSLFELYPTTQEEPAFLQTLTRVYLYCKRTTDSKLLIDQLVNMGYSPDSGIVDKYLYLQKKKVFQNKSSEEIYLNSKTDTFLELIGLDDAIFTVLNLQIAKTLVQLSDSFQEVESLLRLLKDRLPQQELKECLRSMEVRTASVMNKENNTPLPSKNLENALRSTFYQKYNRDFDFSNGSKAILLKRTVKHGSLIFATKLLENTNLNKGKVVVLRSILLRRPFDSEYGNPGYDVRSKNAFLAKLDQLNQSS